jgi:hypothetical protein
MQIRKKGGGDEIKKQNSPVKLLANGFRQEDFYGNFP